MRNSVFTLAFFICLGGMLNAQEKENVIAEGDIVVLGKAQNSDYRYIDFPKKNIIIKRGAIANFNALVGKQLVVQSFETNKRWYDRSCFEAKRWIEFFQVFS